MGNWFHELGLFVFAVGAHWQALATGGIVTALVGAYERRKGRNLSWGAYAFIMTSFLLYSLFAAWQDEHRNTAKVVEEKSSYTSQTSECLADLKATQGTLRDKQVLADSLQAGMTALQGPQAQQAANIASCINNLAKLNPQIMQNIKVIQVKYGETGIDGKFANPKTFIKRYIWEFFILTNIPQKPPFHGFLKCDKDFLITQFPQIPTDVKVMHISDPPPKSIGNNEYELRILDMDAVWNASHPAFLQVMTRDESTGNCTFIPAE